MSMHAAWRMAAVQGVERGFFLRSCHYALPGSRVTPPFAQWYGRVHTDRFLRYHLKPDNPLIGQYTILQELADNELVAGVLSIGAASPPRGSPFPYEMQAVDLEGYVYTPLPPGLLTVKHGILQGANVADLLIAIRVEPLLENLAHWILREAKRFADEVFYAALLAEYESGVAIAKESV